MKNLLCMALCLAAAGCQTGPSGVMDKVLSDFGLRETPEGQVSVADQILANLDEVGKVEMDRLQRDARHGEIKYQEDGLRGLYYKEVKKYTRHRGIDAKVSSGGSQQNTREYTGYIEYSYRIYQSARKRSRTEAAAEAAIIGTEESGRETYRYKFSGSGRWNGGKGERVKRR